MTDINQFHDSLNIEPPSTKKKIPDMLNVLTILTFIGCAFFFLSYIYSYFTVCKSVEMMQQMGDAGDNPMGGMMGELSASMVKQCEMRLPVMIIGIASLLVCFLGALQMRKLRKSGFFIYTIGELAGPIASLVVVGGGMLGALTLIGFVIPIVFIVLYATQLKHMK